MTTAEFIRQRRLALGLSIEWVAANAGISYSTLDNYEHGRGTPNLGRILRILRVLNVDDINVLWAMADAVEGGPHGK